MGSIVAFTKGLKMRVFLLNFTHPFKSFSSVPVFKPPLSISVFGKITQQAEHIFIKAQKSVFYSLKNSNKRNPKPHKNNNNQKTNTQTTQQTSKKKKPTEHPPKRKSQPTNQTKTNKTNKQKNQTIAQERVAFSYK